MRPCQECGEELMGRSDQKFCDNYCKAAFHYKKKREGESTFYHQVQSQLKKNRQVLSYYNKAGLAVVDWEIVIKDGLHPEVYTHTYKAKNGNKYYFCFEHGFRKVRDKDKTKLIMILWQSYMKAEIPPITERGED